MGRFLPIALCLVSAALGAPNRMRVHPDGSLQIHAITEGPDGLLWLAANDGVYRFDGFHYQKLPNYPFRSAMYLAFTNDGTLWAGDFQGLGRLRDGRWDVIFEKDIAGFAAYPDRVYVRLFTDLVEVDLTGAYKTLPVHPRRDLTIDKNGRMWAVCVRPATICSVDPKQPDQLQMLGPTEEYQSAFDSRGRVWTGSDEHAQLLNGTFRLQRRAAAMSDRPGPLFSGRGGHTWFLGETIREVASDFTFRDRVANERYTPISGYEDERGHLWVASLGRGLTEWFPDPNWERWYHEDFGYEPAVQILRDRGGLVVATHKNLYRLNGDRWTPIAAEQRRYDFVVPLDDGGFLATVRDYGVVRLGADGRMLDRIPEPAGEPNRFRKVLRDPKGRIWIGSKRLLFLVEGLPGPLRLREISLPATSDDRQDPVDLGVDATGRLWVGYDLGIAWLDDHDRWTRIATDKPVTMVRSIALGPNEIWVAYRKTGMFSRLRKSGDTWKVTDFTYPPRNTYFFKRDSRGWIWRGTPEGVFVSDGQRTGTEDWIHLNMASGLSANELDMYGFYEDGDGSVWIAGEEGVTRLRPDPSWFQVPKGAPPLRITRIEADGRSALNPQDSAISYPAGTRTLRIEFGSIWTSPFRDAPLKYRVAAVSKDWQYTRNGTIDLHDLKDRDYTVELGYAGDGAPAVSSYNIRIGSAATTMPWTWLLGFLLPGAAVTAFALKTPAFDRMRFRIQKGIFLLNRRYRNGSSDPVPNDWVGETLASRYVLDRVLSRGGFSIVYAGRDLKNGESPVAVKVLNRTTGEARWVRDRFAHELSALRSVDHRGVVRVLDSWISPDGEPCMAMPFLDGPTLRDALRGGPIEPLHAAGLIRKIGDALAAVHARGIVHRDFKPENVVLIGDDPVLIDFGTAGLKSADNELAETVLLAGSFHYMAPERLMRRYSAASDVFSFGVVILEMISGKRLADMRSMFTDEPFVAELTALVGNAADFLAPAFDPEPRRRPGPVDVWANLVAAALERRQA